MKLGKSLSCARIVVSVTCVASLTSAACSSSSARPSGIDTAEETAALDSPNGHIEPGSKELPGFGDPEVDALPLMQALPVRSSAASLAPGETAYRLALVWGHLPPAHDSTSTDVAASVAQWTGSLRADAGAIDLLRTIALGPTDQLDTTTPGTISFRSQTNAYVAGILVRVRVPQGSPPTLQLATSLVAVAIDLSTLEERAGGITRAAAAEGGAGLGWFGFREDLCSRGFVLGRWVKDAPAVGRSFAAITDADGALLGYVRGIWGYARGRSGKVWFDKYIDVGGNAKGLAFGWYGDGFFRGVWGATGEDDVSALEVGKTEGLYTDADAMADGRGVWLGRWSAPCAP